MLSVSLLPTYLQSDILAPEETRAVVERALSLRQANGHVPTVPSRSGDGCVGYDPGLILLNLAATRHPAAEHAYRRLLRLLDRTEAWVEYYTSADAAREGCCRARPWESGVNAMAVVEYLRLRG